jgi:hypothetical protein
MKMQQKQLTTVALPMRASPVDKPAVSTISSEKN